MINLRIRGASRIRRAEHRGEEGRRLKCVMLRQLRVRQLHAIFGPR